MRTSQLVFATLLLAACRPATTGYTSLDDSTEGVANTPAVDVDLEVLDVWSDQTVYEVGDLLDVTATIANNGLEPATFVTRIRMISENADNFGSREGVEFGDEETLLPGGRLDIELDFGEVPAWSGPEEVSFCRYQAQVDVTVSGQVEANYDDNLADSESIEVYFR